MTFYEVWGSGTVGDVDKILLYDGSFETAFILREFKICAEDIADQELMSAKLLTTFAPHEQDWHWGSNQEVGWATWNVPSNARFGNFSLVKENIRIVEDLWIDFSGDSSEVVNYYIKMEKINITDWEGALALATNR